MAEYIDRAELMKFPIRIGHYDKEHGNVNFVYGVETVLEYAEYIPAADVAPVVHGRWEICVDDFDCEYAKCSCCGEELYDANEDTIDMPFNYCPNCGAHMKDGE